MKKFLTIAFAAFLLAVIPHSANAQTKASPATVGHLDLDSLLDIYPAFQAATDSAQAFYTSLENQLYSMQAELERKYNEYDSLKKSLSPLILGIRERELTQMQQNVQLFQQNAQTEFANYRAKLIEPIYNKIIAAIKEVALARGYRYVIDSSKSATVVLYSSPTDDIFNDVRIKLGIPVPTPKPKPAPGGTPAPGGQR